MTDYDRATTVELCSTSSLETLLGNPSLLDALSRCLDKELKIASYWIHLAHALKIPADVYRRFEGCTDYSPTIRMFDYLQATRPELTVGEMNGALTRIFRMDLINLISKAGFKIPEGKIVDTIAKDEKLLDQISLELDNGRCNLGSWRRLGRELKIPRDVLDQFKMYSAQSPTKILFRLLKMKYPRLTVGTLKYHIKEMGRNDVLKILDSCSAEDSSLVVDSIKIDSDILDEMEKQLNKSIPGVGNWRSLAMRLEISNDNCDEFDPAGSGQLSQRSPTKMMLKWLAGARKDITICDVIHGLEEIKRYDAIKILTSHYNNVIDVCRETDECMMTCTDGLAAFALEPQAGEPEGKKKLKRGRNENPLVQESAAASSSKEIASCGHCGGLPCKMEYFTGRETEIFEVMDNLKDNNYRGVIVVAPPGYGKTSLVVQVAHKFIEEDNFVIYVSSRGVTSLYDFTCKIIQALGLDPGLNPIREALSRLRSRDQNTVLVVDNIDDLLHLDGSNNDLKERNTASKMGGNTCEKQLATTIDLPGIGPVNKRKAACAEEFQNFLDEIGQTCSNVKTLITSRQKLQFVRTLRWMKELEPLSISNAGNLLMKLCTSLSQKQAEELGQICGGIPLNLCNIASLIQSKGYATTEGLLSGYIEELSSSPPSKLMRVFHSQKKCLDLCFQRLDPQLQELLVSISVFPGMFTLEQAKVVSQHSVQAVDMVEKIEALVEHCLVRFDKCPKQYSVHSFIRSFCIVQGQNDHLKDCYKKAKENFADHYVTLLEDLYNTFLSKESRKAIVDYRNEKENISQLLSMCTNEEEIGVKTGKKCIDVINMAAPMIAKVTGRTEFERIFNLLAYRWCQDHRRYADCLVSIGMKIVLACACSPRICASALEDAMTYLRVANKLQEDNGIADGNGRAQCLAKLGRCNVWHGLIEDGLQMLADAQNVRHDQLQKDSGVISNVLLAACFNDFAAAQSYRSKILCALHISLELVLPEYHKLLGEHPYTASVLNSIGNYYQAAGDYDNAIKYTTQALSMRNSLLGEHQETARSYYDLGVALEGKELYEEALENLQLAAKIQDEVLDTHEETMRSHQEIACVLKLLGKEEEAMAARSQAQKIFRELPDTTARESRPKHLESQTEPSDIPPKS